MFVRFAAVSLVVGALFACDKATPTAPPVDVQPSLASGSVESPASVGSNVGEQNRGEEQGARSESRDERGRIFNVTFTKWVTVWPNMEGVVGGDAGTGTFAGEILDYNPGPEITRIEALYHINGGRHSFTAHNFVTQNEVTRTAVITGEITDGWMKGRKVSGGYDIISCPEKTLGLCFRGALQIRPAAER